MVASAVLPVVVESVFADCFSEQRAASCSQESINDERDAGADVFVAR